jgi:hypothetical protein
MSNTQSMVPDSGVRPPAMPDDSPPVLHWCWKSAVHSTPELHESRIPWWLGVCESTVIPRVVWTYWHGSPLPLIVDACLASWQKHLAGYRIVLLGPRNLPAGIPPLPPGFGVWAPQVQSDWVRLAVLATFGGVWMDATTLLSDSSHRGASKTDIARSNPLSFVQALAALDPPDVIGYFNVERTINPAYPMLENWFLAAPAQSSFMLRWWHTFDAMLTADGSSDISRVTTGITILDLLQGFSHAPDYFACHAAAQWVMRQYGGRLALLPAELDAFFEPHSRGWNPERVCSWLCDVGTDGNRPSAKPLTKLISLLWQPLEERLQRGDFDRDSILGDLCTMSLA